MRALIWARKTLRRGGVQEADSAAGQTWGTRALEDSHRTLLASRLERLGRWQCPR